jgi:hypothetical protein
MIAPQLYKQTYRVRIEAATAVLLKNHHRLPRQTDFLYQKGLQEYG